MQGSTAARHIRNFNHFNFMPLKHVLTPSHFNFMPLKHVVTPRPAPCAQPTPTPFPAYRHISHLGTTQCWVSFLSLNPQQSQASRS